MHFLKVHTADRGECLINMAHVEAVHSTVSGQSEIVFVGGSRLSVRELYAGLAVLLTGGSDE